MCKRKAADNDNDWTSVFILGEAPHTGAIEALHAGPKIGIQWDFDHVSSILKELLESNPGFDAFLFGGSPELVEIKTAPFNDGRLTRIPILNIILIRTDYQPPPFVAIRQNQQATEKILRFEDLRLEWKRNDKWAHPLSDHQGRVFTLHSSSRKTKTSFKAQTDEDKFQYEYASLFYMRPSMDMQMEANDDTKLAIPFANFSYVKPDGEVVVENEEFDREDQNLGTFIPEFLENFDLDDSHKGGVKLAIQEAFRQKRAEKQAKVDLLMNKYDRETLEEVKVYKFYPRNSFVIDEVKAAFVGGYYGKANESF